MNNSWNTEALNARIANDGARLRYPAGSPDANEISAYDAAILDLPSFEQACVLGMTPELRNLAAQRFSQFSSVDNNPNAIAIYRDWIDPSLSKRGKIIEANWFDFLSKHTHHFDAIFGDGIFGNLPDEASHYQLLSLIAHSLKPGGFFVTRMALIPNEFNPELSTWRQLRDRFRRNEIDEAEFGFGVRLLGHYLCCYHPSTHILDNEKLFLECQQAMNSGELREEEHLAISRYYFGSTNCIVSQDLWESLITAIGGSFEIQECWGKEWYSYYPVYRISFPNL